MAQFDERLNALSFPYDLDNWGRTCSWSNRLAEWGNKWMGLVMNIQAAIQAINGVRQVLQQTVSDFATMEEAMAQVRKYTGMTTDEVKDLNEALKKIDTRTSRERLNELAGDAGKLGITAKDCHLHFCLF